MIKRYTTPQMEFVWSIERKFELWQQVELAALRAWCEASVITHQAYDEIQNNLQPVCPNRVAQLDELVHHDVIAFLTAWGEQEHMADYSKYLHRGMTSSDLIDTATSLSIRQAGEFIITDLRSLQQVCRELAIAHQYSYCIGRSHGVHAEPTTFGLKCLRWMDDLIRAEELIEKAIRTNSIGMFSGPVGSYTNISPCIEERACELLNLKPAPITTQVISRDRHAEFIFALATLGCIIENIATEIRHLQRTEVLEVEEPFYESQKGSSAMPHKRNPWRSENLCGLARILRAFVQPAMEDITLWHERDISHSSVERIVLPDSCHLAHFMVQRMHRILKDLRVYPQNMQRNAQVYGGVSFSQKVLLALVDTGMKREDAYSIVQRIAHKVWNTPGGDFLAELQQAEEITSRISEEALMACFKVDLQYIDRIYKRFNLSS